MLTLASCAVGWWLGKVAYSRFEEWRHLRRLEALNRENNGT